jgi:hypothetical protein
VKFEKILTFLIVHNEAIIQWTLAAIIGSSAWVFFRSMFGSGLKRSEAMIDANLSEVSAILQKILAQTSGLPMVAVGGAVAPGATAQAAAGALGAGASIPSGAIDVAELEKVKKTLIVTEEELAKYKADPLSEKFKAQSILLDELKSKLAEYEILEDDIADLSLYKDENARLKAELENFKNSGQTPESIVEEFASVVDQNKGVETAGENVTELPVTGDPMADFASAIQAEKGPASIPTEAAPPPPVEAPVEAAASAPTETPAPGGAADAGGATADLFAEFSGNLDTDRVMEELVHLEKMAGADGKEALEEQLDTDKMVAEAASLPKA